MRTLIVNNKALHFRHIGRPIGRHFTFYLDDTRLMDEPLINEKINDEVSKFLLQSGSDGETEDSYEGLEVWYPSPEPKPASPARLFAELIAEGRGKTYMRKIHREPAHGYWYFPDTQESSVRYPNVTIVDWGSVTGTTVMQMLRLAAEAGAERVLVCIILSLLPLVEEIFLSRLGTLRVQRRLGQKDQVPLLPFAELRADEETGAEWKEVNPEVNVRFLSRVPISAYDAHECPICQQLTRLSQERYPTGLLEAFAIEQKNNRLKLSKREEIVGTDPKDIDGRELRGSSAAWMLYFRGSLIDALGSTRVRKQILDEIHNLAREACGRDVPPNNVLSFLHFLSIETQWLRRPPLHFMPIHDLITEIALAVARNQEVTIEDRLNAIIVLRTHAKFTFAQKFEDLYESASGPEYETLVRQLLYDAFTYIVRPYHQAAKVFEPLKSGLSAVLKRVREDDLHASPQVVETLELLLSRAQSGYQKARYKSLTPSQAWKELQRILSDFKPHQAAVEGVTRILSEINFHAREVEAKLRATESSGLDGIEIGSLNTGWLRRLNTNWSAPRDFLGNTLFQLLACLSDVLQSEEGRNKLGYETTKTLIDWVGSDIPLSESEFSQLVKCISQNPNEILLRKNWEALKWHINFYWEILLKPKGIDATPSRLLEFLELAPTSLGKTVVAVYEEMKGTLPPHYVEGLDGLQNGDEKVFCTEGLLTDAIGQLLGNIKKHWTKELQPTLRVLFEKEVREDRVSLFVWNNMTEEKAEDERGAGLELLRDRFDPFRAELKIHSRLASDWATYKVELNFERSD